MTIKLPWEGMKQVYKLRRAMYRSLRSQGAHRWEAYNTPRALFKSTLRLDWQLLIQALIEWPLLVLLEVLIIGMDKLTPTQFLTVFGITGGASTWALLGRSDSPLLYVALIAIWMGVGIMLGFALEKLHDQ